MSEPIELKEVICDRCNEVRALTHKVVSTAVVMDVCRKCGIEALTEIAKRNEGRTAAYGVRMGAMVVIPLIGGVHVEAC